MLSKLYILLIVAVSPLLVFGQTDEMKHSFVGVESCGMCHKTEKQGKQLDIWKESKHSKAYETLKTEKADKIAAELGHTTPAVETEDCLKCHASGYNVEAKFKEAKFKVEDGVQCETCHGAGSDYKAMKIMKSREESIANGLNPIEDMETFCKSCHNTESPTYVEADVNEMWEKIKHPVPSK